MTIPAGIAPITCGSAPMCTWSTWEGKAPIQWIETEDRPRACPFVFMPPGADAPAPSAIKIAIIRAVQKIHGNLRSASPFATEREHESQSIRSPQLCLCDQHD